MLLESFDRQLNLVRGFGIVDPESLGRKMAECLVVEVRVILTADEPKVCLPHVGLLSRDDETVSFKPLDELENDARQRKLRLSDFMLNQIGAADAWGKFTWDTVFQKYSEPYAGMDLLARLGSQLLRFRMSKDPMLKEVPLHMLLEGMCLVVHDAICCGAGVVLETIGWFLPFPEISFRADDILLDTIRGMKASAGKNRRVPDLSDFKVSKLRVGPLPKAV